MKASEIIESRAPLWRKLEVLCGQLEARGGRRRLGAHRRTEFASLYRSACADLALADAHQLPSDTVRFLHQLVGRAHNQLYRTRGVDFQSAWEELFKRTPHRLFHDSALRLAAALFWGGFMASMFLASNYSPVPEFARTLLGEDQMMSLENKYAEPIGGSGSASGGESFMAGFYIWNNASIGLRCFVMGLIFGVGGMFATLFHAVFLGAAFGYMTTTPQSQNFFTFVTAHGPFELTAIVLSAAAGMRLGFALVDTRGLSRSDALLAAGREAMPTMFAAVMLFLLAAFIEGFISPSALPYSIKAIVAMISTMSLLGYFIVLGSHGLDETLPHRME